MSDSQTQGHAIRSIFHPNLIVSAIAIIALCLHLHAQEVCAGLVGRVTVPSGGAIVGAAVTARHEARGTSWRATTNEDGIYAYPRIPSGTYSLKVEATGFKISTRPNIV